MLWDDPVDGWVSKTLWCSNFVHSGMITIQEIRLLNLLWLTAITLQRYHVLQIDGGSVISITYILGFWSRQTVFSPVWWNMSPLFFLVYFYTKTRILSSRSNANSSSFFQAAFFHNFSSFFFSSEFCSIAENSAV